VAWVAPALNSGQSHERRSYVFVVTTSGQERENELGATCEKQRYFGPKKACLSQKRPFFDKKRAKIEGLTLLESNEVKFATYSLCYSYESFAIVKVAKKRENVFSFPFSVLIRHPGDTPLLLQYAASGGNYVQKAVDSGQLSE